MDIRSGRPQRIDNLLVCYGNICYQFYINIWFLTIDDGIKKCRIIICIKGFKWQFYTYTKRFELPYVHFVCPLNEVKNGKNR